MDLSYHARLGWQSERHDPLRDQIILQDLVILDIQEVYSVVQEVPDGTSPVGGS
jgi:hypothetical protein